MKEQNNKVKESFYITTPVYYANAQPHIGHAYATLLADILTRFNQQSNKKTFFLVGMDEHGAKIAEKAEAENKNPQELVDEISNNFQHLWQKLNIQNDVFIRTTNSLHKKTVQIVLQKLYDQKLIYKGEYEGLYCVGCEQFKNESDLIDGKCPDHNKKPELVKEESYMLKMSDRQAELITQIKNDEFKIRPQKYKKEILSFLESQKLKDLSISRKNVAWGIPLPFDQKHTAYVWFDAFLSYLTGLGWEGEIPPSIKNCNFWPADINLIGKDILRVHATIWPIMLMHLEINLPKKLLVHGHILSGGQKMSKSIGNVISINEMIENFGIDGTRYLLMSAGTFGEDVDITMERLIDKYNADLANGLGNLVSRVIKLGENMTTQKIAKEKVLKQRENLKELVEKMEFAKYLETVWGIIRVSNKLIEDEKPWELIKNDQEKFEKVMITLIQDLELVAELLVPILPETSEKIKTSLEDKEKIILFARV
jgi:methionyl-tRNA synthetase